jgi:hypothetical protein
MIETAINGSLKNYWEDKPETVSGNTIFEKGSDWDIKTDAQFFLEELRGKDYKELWERRYASEHMLIKQIVESKEGPLVWHHFRDYLNIAQAANVSLPERVLEAAVVNESIHVARKAAEFPLTVSQMTYLLVRPEITVHDTREITGMQLNAGNNMGNVNRAARLATEVRAIMTR